VRPGLPDSYEALFHAVDLPAFYLGLRGSDQRLLLGLRQPQLERAIGVVYRPETERLGHYFRAPGGSVRRPHPLRPDPRR
jgi:erythromycin esterase-like protein